MQTFIFALISILNCQLIRCSTEPTCSHPIYCEGDLLDTVQRAEIFEDSKTFVDMVQINPSSKTLENFETLKRQTRNNLTNDQVKQFVDDNFLEKGELEPWTPPDYNSNPAFLSKIDDVNVRKFAAALVSIWPTLGRQMTQHVKKNTDRHSLLPVPNNFIVPGGRFREIYYWDTYWIIKGLLICEMKDTARQMIENLLWLVKTYGFVPNGNRVYYLNRSQPPLLTHMVSLYIEATNDLKWLRKNIQILDKEMKWWLANRTVTVAKDGINYTLAHYACRSGTPRPESYMEDIIVCSVYEEQNRKEECYKELKSSAESGWDFSTRWIFDSEGNASSNLAEIQTSRVLPVDLNTFLYKAFDELTSLYLKVGHTYKVVQWRDKAEQWKQAILMIFYNAKDGIWYDYDIVLARQRNIFYASNFAPLWTEQFQVYVARQYGSSATKYFTDQGMEKYVGGVPTSLQDSGEQWDFPNAWPPLQEIVILGLLKSRDVNATRLAETLGKRWIAAMIKGYGTTKKMFEKYDAVKSGEYGGGGEYPVQTGFGWTNGVALSLIIELYVNGDQFRNNQEKDDEVFPE